LTAISSFQKIRILHLSNDKINYFKDLPTSIQVLDLSLNPLKRLPDILNFSNLVELDLTHSEISSYPSKMERVKLIFIIIGYSNLPSQNDSKNFLQLPQQNLYGFEVAIKKDPTISEILCSVKIYKSTSMEL
jgi:Leucine-rich repeat (LRR) protein